MSVEQAVLVAHVRELLGGCLGASPIPFGIPKGRGLVPTGAWWVGLYCGLSYFLLFCVGPQLSLLGQPEKHLFWLSVYGSVYVTWAVAIARLTSEAVLRIVRDDIGPLLSVGTAQKISADLERRFAARRISMVSWPVGIAGAVVAGWAMSREAPGVPLQIAWWSLGWLALFVTAARATDVARFYALFAEHLDDERKGFYMLDPARSTLVTAVAALGQRMLLFWVGIAISVLMLVLFVAIASNARRGLFDFPDVRSWKFAPTTFELLVVPITSAFALPFGTYVFLRSENAISTAVKSAIRDTLAEMEREVAGLFARRQELSDAEWRRLSEQKELHRTLASAGAYRSFLISGVSLLVPVIGPAVTLLLKYLSSSSGSTFPD